MVMVYYIAVDLGASSGRVMLCDGESLTEAFRFTHVMREDGMYVRWDWTHLLQGVAQGIQAAVRLAAEQGGIVQGVGVDAWGVDVGLLDAQGELINDPVCYRSAALAGVGAELNGLVQGDLYARTGIPPLDINTLMQLYALRRDYPQELEQAYVMLPIGDLLVYYLTGKRVVGAELSAASTTQMLLPDGSGWNLSLMRELELPTRLLPPLRQAGTAAGVLDYDGLPPIMVYTVAQHDTAAAFYAASRQVRSGERALLLSCGTWGLLGTVLDSPLLSDAAFSNERAADGRVAYLQNIQGLWHLQELRREFAAAGVSFSYDDMERLARAADSSEGMRIREVYEQLGQAFGDAAAGMAAATGIGYDSLHVVGGGVKDALLMELLAQYTGLQVFPDEAEAAAWGNALMQMDAAARES